MGLRKAFKSWFLTEVAEVKETVGDLTDKAESALRKRERDLKATPEEKLENLQGEITDDEDAFSDARAKIDAKVAQAKAAEAADRLTDAEIKDAARREVDNAEEYGHRSEVEGAMNEAKAKAALDQARAAERLAQIRKEMGTDS